MLKIKYHGCIIFLSISLSSILWMRVLLVHSMKCLPLPVLTECPCCSHSLCPRSHSESRWRKRWGTRAQHKLHNILLKQMGLTADCSKRGILFQQLLNDKSGGLGENPCVACINWMLFGLMNQPLPHPPSDLQKGSLNPSAG